MSRAQVIEVGVERKGACCPRCGRPFSDWFRWDGDRYCWPCYAGDPPNPFPTLGFIVACVRHLVGRITGRPHTLWSEYV